MLVQVFQFEAQAVRTIQSDNGETLFVGRDVCEVLGYKDTTNAMKQHCKGVAKHHPLQTAGGIQEMRVITEPDLYRLIIGSNLPSAQKFEAWVFEEVLPSIRKNGTYSTPKSTPVKEAFDLVPSVMAAALAFGLDKNAAAISTNQAVQKITGSNVLELLGHTHLIAEKQNLIYTPTELGANFLNGISARRVNSLLAEAGLQFKEGDHWKPLPVADGLYRLLDTGKKHGNGTPVQQLKWFEEVSSRIKVDPE